MLKIVLTITAVIGLLAVLGAAWAKHNGYCAGGDRMQYVAERVARKLDLTDEQQAKLQTFTETLRQLRGDWGGRRKALTDELAGLLAAPSLDRNRVGELLDEQHQAMARRKGKIVDAFADFSDSLKPEQRTRLSELSGERLGHRWGHPHWTH